MTFSREYELDRAVIGSRGFKPTLARILYEAARAGVAGDYDRRRKLLDVAQHRLLEQQRDARRTG